MARSNKTLVPEAKQALNQFKMEAANEVGVTLNQGYNGQLTSAQAGSIGGQMVDIVPTVRTKKYERKSRIKRGYKVEVEYGICLTVKGFFAEQHRVKKGELLHKKAESEAHGERSARLLIWKGATRAETGENSGILRRKDPSVLPNEIVGRS